MVSVYRGTMLAVVFHTSDDVLRTGAILYY